MQNDESKKQLAVFDSLLNGLAEVANDPKATANSFFAQTIQVVETILAPKWCAILASGPNDSVMFVHGTLGARQQLESIRENSIDRINSDWIISASEPQIVVSEIQSRTTAWGWLTVEVDQPEASSVQRAIVSGVSEIVHEFIRSQDRKTLAEDQSYADDLVRFSLNAHASLDPVEVAHHLANDARILLGCERVCFFSVIRNRPKLLAISSVATIEGRTELIKNMKSMVSLAVKSGEPIFSDQPLQDLRQSKLLDEHCNKTGLPFVFGIPLFRRGKQGLVKRTTVGYLLAESTVDVDRFKFARVISFVAPHAEAAIGNAATHSEIPFRRTLCAIGRTTNFANLSKMTLGAGLVGLAILATMLVKTDFKVRIHGELRPAIERNVFSPRDGIVESVFVSHGDTVREKEPLVQIRSPDLDLEIEKSDGEIRKLKQWKDSKQIALTQISSSEPDPNLAAQLASEISDIEFQIASLAEKARFLRQEREELQIECPIEGQVTTWEVKQKLTNKPVRWGDPIVNVARLDGDWNIVFRVPERRIGYILDQQLHLRRGEDLELQFFLESNPGETFRVPVVEIAQSAGQDPELGPVTLLTCHAPSELIARRQGASVAADVFCGKKSICFVWTREMRDALRRRFVW